MSITKPYHRNHRGIVDGKNSGYSSWAYIRNKDYALSPEHYVRAFLLIQKDLITLFEYIEPSEKSLHAYSYRMHELLMRTCIEIEANFKAILTENTYTPTQDRFGNDVYNIGIFKKVNKTHHLSSYKVALPTWHGSKKEFQPFKDWETKPLEWYRAYNSSKHDRNTEFEKANLENLLNAVMALLVLLSAQFKQENFSPDDDTLSMGAINYHDQFYLGFESAIGGHFRIKFPDDWTDEEKYDFDWSELEKQLDRFQKINYNLIT